MSRIPPLQCSRPDLSAFSWRPLHRDPETPTSKSIPPPASYSLPTQIEIIGSDEESPPDTPPRTKKRLCRRVVESEDEELEVDAVVEFTAKDVEFNSPRHPPKQLDVPGVEEVDSADSSEVQSDSGDDEDDESSVADSQSADDPLGIDTALRRCESEAERVSSLPEVPRTVVSTGLLGSFVRNLREFQELGVAWLLRLAEHGISGILADEMGLGKTVQTAALLDLLRHTSASPHLVVVPTSVLDNWARELSVSAPNLRVQLYSGSQKERASIRLRTREVELGDTPPHVWVTTYPAVANDEDLKFLRKRRFDYLILDEAHAIKNVNSQRHRKLLMLRTRRRLLLTGTPLQNHLDELFAVLSFLFPELFGGAAELIVLLRQLRRIEVADPGHADSAYLARIGRILGPFLLRRRKTEVLASLPPKVEHVLRCELPDTQRKLYRRLAESSRKSWESGGGGAALVSNLLMQLRKAANHPLLGRQKFELAHIQTLATRFVDEAGAASSLDRLRAVADATESLLALSDLELHRTCLQGSAEMAALTQVGLPDFLASAKVAVLCELLPRLHAENHRVLLFSEMTRVLDILEVVLGHLGLEFVRLDGSTPANARQPLVDRFNEDASVFAFLLSTRAGGQGLNLVAADTVIFHDVSFNPHVDTQAADRCHRLGQTRDVSVYKLVACGTVDEHILRLANEKLALSTRILDRPSSPESESSLDVLPVIQEEDSKKDEMTLLLGALADS